VKFSKSQLPIKFIVHNNLELNVGNSCQVAYATREPCEKHLAEARKMYELGDFLGARKARSDGGRAIDQSGYASVCKSQLKDLGLSVFQ